MNNIMIVDDGFCDNKKRKLTRKEYLDTCYLTAKRGSELKQSKLDESDVRLILDLVEERECLKAKAKRLTNKKIAEKFGVHFRTIDRITQNIGWTHV